MAALPDSVFTMPPLGAAMFDHLHNKLVHFPVAFALAALLFLFLARKRGEFEPAAHLMIWIAAVSAIATYFTGRMQEEAFHASPKEWVVEIHEKLGTATTLGLAAWTAVITFARTRRFALAWGVLIAALVLATAFFGGLIAHGH